MVCWIFLCFLDSSICLLPACPLVDLFDCSFLPPSQTPPNPRLLTRLTPIRPHSTMKPCGRVHSSAVCFRNRTHNKQYTRVLLQLPVAFGPIFVTCHGSQRPSATRLRTPEDALSNVFVWLTSWSKFGVFVFGTNLHDIPVCPVQVASFGLSCQTIWIGHQKNSSNQRTH